jgi:hypothetical protein
MRFKTKSTDLIIIFFFFYLDELCCLAYANYKSDLQWLNPLDGGSAEPKATTCAGQHKHRINAGIYASSGLQTRNPFVCAGEKMSCLRRGGDGHRLIILLRRLKQSGLAVQDIQHPQRRWEMFTKAVWEILIRRNKFRGSEAHRVMTSIWILQKELLRVQTEVTSCRLVSIWGFLCTR